MELKRVTERGKEAGRQTEERKDRDELPEG